MTPQEHYQAGQLTEAIQAPAGAVKKQPTDTDVRGSLCELLRFGGELGRADKQLDAIGLQCPETMVGVSLIRQLIRAETCRQEFHTAGHLPEFLHEPPGYLRKHLEVSVSLGDGNPAEAVALFEQAEEERPILHGTCTGESFEDLRDLDDPTVWREDERAPVRGLGQREFLIGDRVRPIMEFENLQFSQAST